MSSIVVSDNIPVAETLFIINDIEQDHSSKNYTPIHQTQKWYKPPTHFSAPGATPPLRTLPNVV